MKVMLIGSEGYVGSYIKHSLSNKYHFEYLDTNWFGREVEEGKDLRYLSRQNIAQFDAVVLLAGHSSVKMCDNNMLSSFRNNVQNFVEILDKCQGIKLIYASSSSVYGNTNKMIVDETYNSYVPTSFYDISKQIIDMYASKSDIEYYGLRFGTINGWSPRLRNDIMINSMVCNAIEYGQIELYCKHINRAILGIKDLSCAMEKILNNKTDNRGVYNLGSFNATAEEMAYRVGEIMSVPVIEKECVGVGGYDFSINTDKFSRTFGYEFSESIESITKSLKDNITTCEISNRNEAKKYEI